jgi:hypothetical protein
LGRALNILEIKDPPYPSCRGTIIIRTIIATAAFRIRRGFYRKNAPGQ